MHHNHVSYLRKDIKLINISESVIKEGFAQYQLYFAPNSHK